MDFDEFGNYKAGIHAVSLEWFKNHLVDEAEKSTTRSRNLTSFIEFCKLQQVKEYIDTITYVLIDGSFVTNKIDPHDIDVLFISEFVGENYEELISFSEQAKRTYAFFAKVKREAYKYHSDIYFIPKVKLDLIQSLAPDHPDVSNYCSKLDYQYKYWLGQFTFDRDERPKGIFKIVGGEFSE